VITELFLLGVTGNVLQENTDGKSAFLRGGSIRPKILVEGKSPTNHLQQWSQHQPEQKMLQYRGSIH